MLLLASFKATFHSASFEIPVRPMHEDQMMPTEKSVMRWWYTLIFTHQTLRSFKTRSESNLQGLQNARFSELPGALPSGRPSGLCPEATEGLKFP